MTATKKLTAYGAVVVAALAMGFALLTAAFAAPSVGDVSDIVAGDATGDDARELTVIDDNHGQLVTVEGNFTIVTQPASGGSVSVDENLPLELVKTEVKSETSVDAKTIKVTGTKKFPSSGHFFIDGAVTDLVDGDDEPIADAPETPIADGTAAGAVGLEDANDEIVYCTGKTMDSLTGCDRGFGHTTGRVHLAGSVVYPIKYSTIVLIPFTGDLDTSNDNAGLGTLNVADHSVFAKAGQLIAIESGFGENGHAAFGYNGRSGSTLIRADLVDDRTLAVGTDVFQFGRTVDTARIDIKVDNGFTGSFTYEYKYAAVGDKDGDEATVTVTVISDDPVANDVSGTVTATQPTPLPIILVFSGTDSSSISKAPAGLDFTSLPTAGLLLLTPGPRLICTDVDVPVLGEVMTNCSAHVLYTPLLGASGTDTFTYTITNDDHTSVPATVTVTLPGGMVPPMVDVPAPTMGEGFAGALAPGVTLTTYGGGTVAQLNADASTAGATSVAVTDSGTFVVLVVDGPSFVNRAFNDLFSDGVPAGTVVLVLVSS